MAVEHGLSFAEATRLLSRADVSDIADDGGAASSDPSWSHIAAGPWLATVLRELRSPAQLAAPVDPERQLRGTLRPYQEAGVRWLDLLARLGLGACLADDMGLGKTIQVLALLLHQKQQETQHEKRPGVDRGKRLPSLIVAPASLLANWESEIARFAPALRAVVAHPSVMPRDALSALDAEALAGVDLVITSYGSLLRTPCFTTLQWNFVILDEAQAIKNPGAKQTRAAKSLTARTRVALTGTPVENRLSDLWSIFTAASRKDQAREARTEAHPGGRGRPRHRSHLLGNGVVHQSRALQRSHEPAATRAELCAQRSGAAPGGRPWHR